MEALMQEAPITDYVTLRITIQDHVEQLEFAVSDLGTQDMFIGHKWLKLHNPSIDGESRNTI